MDKRNQLEERWSREYHDFMQGEGITPPAHVSEAVRLRIAKDLNPSGIKIFAKLCLCTIIGGLLSLALCPQFGFGITHHSSFLMHFFEGLGETWCTIVCGAIFLGVSTAFAGLILGIEEIRVIHRKKFLQIPCVALLVLSAFVCAGAEVLISYAILWWVGAVIAGLATFEASSAVRFYLWKHAATF